MKIAIIGCGNMGGGIARRLSQKHEHLIYFDQNVKKCSELSKETKGIVASNLQEAVKEADIIILAVKPKDVFQVAGQLHGIIKPSQILVSLLAGTATSSLRHSFGEHVAVIRMMPNLAVLFGQGIVVLAENEELSDERRRELSEVFSFLGKVYWFHEEMFDAITSLSASGLGFAFVVIEAMTEAAIALGFPARQGEELVLQMLRGALTMIEETGRHPGELKWQVASPGGTTIAGLAKLEESTLRSGLMNAFLAAYHKSKSLSTGHSN